MSTLVNRSRFKLAATYLVDTSSPREHYPRGIAFPPLQSDEMVGNENKQGCGGRPEGFPSLKQVK